jgi:hypothetical protein
VSLVAVDGQWSMVVAIRSRSMGGIGWGAGQHASDGNVGIRPTLYRAVAWMASLCIRDADLILQEMLTRR